MRPVIRQLLLVAGPGWVVSGVGVVTSLRQLGVVLNANPTANVTVLGDYNAQPDGVFSASPIGTTSATTYTGTFDGAGYTIQNFRLLDTSATPGLEDGGAVFTDEEITRLVALSGVDDIDYVDDGDSAHTLSARLVEWLVDLARSPPP